MSERIMVTGGAGFIGSHLARAYIAAGHEVAVLDNLSTGDRRNVPGHARFYGVDLRDERAVQGAFADFRPAVVNHHAAQSSVKVSAREPGLTAAVNLTGTETVLQAAMSCGARRVIFASSGAVYGDCDCHKAEEDDPAPLSLYGETKLGGERAVTLYEDNLSPVVFRYGNVYGYGQDPQGEAGVVAVWAGKLLAGQPVQLFGDGEQTRDYIAVADVVRANLLALDGPAGTYNVATGVSTRLLDVLNALEDATGSHVPSERLPVTPGDARNVRLDCSKATTQLGFTARVDLAQGIDWYVDAVRHAS